jgi:catechol 2,3-dioxygenase-like lactoylglutathione lyase family enzyme
MPVNLNKFYHVAINVRDLDKSIAFYESIGFRLTAKFRMEGELGIATARAFGVPFNPINAAFLKLGQGASSMIVDLCEYTDPPTEARPPASYNTVGMGRIAFHVDDIEQVHAELLALGIRMLGPLEYTIPPGGQRCGVFAFYDPDGTILEVLSGVEHMAA